MDRLKGLKCRECGRSYPSAPVHVCEFCFGPLEVDYDYAAVRARVTRARIESGPHSIWRYADLLPLELGRTAAAAGQASASRPSCARATSARSSASASSTSRTTPCATPRGRSRIAWSRWRSRRRRSSASTPSPAPPPATSRTRWPPTPRRPGCTPTSSSPSTSSRARSRRRWSTSPPWWRWRAPTTRSTASAPRSPTSTGGRSSTSTSAPTTREGSKTYGYEIAEQLGWRAPAHVVVPCAGGALMTKIAKAFQRAAGARSHPRGSAPGCTRPRPLGCGPIVTMIKNDTDVLVPSAEHHREVARHRQPRRRLLRLSRRQGLRGLRRARHRGGDRRGMQLLARTEGCSPRRRAASPSRRPGS